MENYVKSRLIDTSLRIEFDKVHNNADEFVKEFSKLTQSDEDPIGEWLRLTKAKNGNLGGESTILLELMVEIYRKVESLEKTIHSVKKEYVTLQYKDEIRTIGHSCFKMQCANLEENVLYYGRVELPTFPSRIVPIYFIYQENLAWVEQIHARDEVEWDSYVASKERALIRAIRQKRSEDDK